MKPHVPRNPHLRDLLEDLGGTCWWCGQLADSREHKYKKSDLVRHWNGPRSLLWGGDPRFMYAVKSINKDPAVKFEKTMCERCNTRRSQPFDRAYETYSDYVAVALPKLHLRSGIDFREIYGSDWRSHQLRLARYFIKKFGCRMIDEGIRVPSQMVAFLDGKVNRLRDIQLAFYTDRQLLAQFGTDASAMRLGLSGTAVLLSRSKRRINGFIAAETINYVGVRFQWNRGSGWPDSFFPHQVPILNHMLNEEHMISPTGQAPSWEDPFA